MSNDHSSRSDDLMCYEDTFYFTFYLRRLGWDTDDTSLFSSHKTWLTDKTKALFLFIMYASRPGLGESSRPSFLLQTFGRRPVHFCSR